MDGVGQIQLYFLFLIAIYFLKVTSSGRNLAPLKGFSLMLLVGGGGYVVCLCWLSFSSMLHDSILSYCLFWSFVYLEFQIIQLVLFPQRTGPCAFKWSWKWRISGTPPSPLSFISIGPNVSPTSLWTRWEEGVNEASGIGGEIDSWEYEKGGRVHWIICKQKSFL